MQYLYLLFFVISFQTSSIEECEICGEYRGGREFYSWTTLILKPNGEYEFSESRHTMQSIKDKGKWFFKNDNLVFDSANKTQWKSQNFKKKKKKYFFKNQKCEVQEDCLLIKKEGNMGFNLAYYSLYKIEK